MTSTDIYKSKGLSIFNLNVFSSAGLYISRSAYNSLILKIINVLTRNYSHLRSKLTYSVFKGAAAALRLCSQSVKFLWSKSGNPIEPPEASPIRNNINYINLQQNTWLDRDCTFLNTPDMEIFTDLFFFDFSTSPVKFFLRMAIRWHCKL